MTLASVGIAVGLVGAFAATSALGSLLYGINALDPVTYAVVAMALATTALIASWLPAARPESIRSSPCGPTDHRCGLVGQPERIEVIAGAEINPSIRNRRRGMAQIIEIGDADWRQTAIGLEH